MTGGDDDDSTDPYWEHSLGMLDPGYEYFPCSPH